MGDTQTTQTTTNGTNQDDTIHKILKYWFGEGKDVKADDYSHNSVVWWGGSEEVDKEIETSFGQYVFSTHKLVAMMVMLRTMA